MLAWDSSALYCVPMGLPWVSITLMGGPEQQLGLVEFPLGKTHHGESRALCYGGESHPLARRAPKMPCREGFLLLTPLGTAFLGPSAGIPPPVQELKAAVTPSWCVVFWGEELVAPPPAPPSLLFLPVASALAQVGLMWGRDLL